MHIRSAVPNDLSACLQLNASFDTQRVWQLDLRETRSQVSAQLRAVDLPRQVRVDYPAPHNALLMHWQRGYCILVAEDLRSRQVTGYIDVGPEPDSQTGWIWHLVVDQGCRRQGIGSALLQAATRWCLDHQLYRLMAPVQIQNDAGIQFCHRRGFSFCGFNDQFYQSGSVALFFGRNLK